MRIVRRIEDFFVRSYFKSVTYVVFFFMLFVTISTFFISRYTFIKTVIKVPVFLTVNQEVVFVCDENLLCRKTKIYTDDLFAKKQNIDHINTESRNVLSSSVNFYIKLICNKFSKSCTKEQISDIKNKIFNVHYRTEYYQKTLIDIFYKSLKNALTGNAKNICKFVRDNGSIEELYCSLGHTHLIITGSLLLQNIYNNIAFDKLSVDNFNFIDFFIKEAKFKGNIWNTIDLRFITNNNSVYADFAGIKNSIYGSFVTIGISLLFSIFIGTLAALFLQEFWTDNKSILRRIVLINIDNISAVPSILCGLLGAVLYINFFGLPRSSILVGSFTISFMVFPLILTSARNAIMSVPKDIKDLAYSIGASKYRVTFLHVLPMSINGIITGSLLVLGKIASETACLLIVGLTAFSTELPKSIFDSTSTIATQIYSWMEMPDINFKYRIYAGMSILIVLSFSISLVIRTIGYRKSKKKRLR